TRRPGAPLWPAGHLPLKGGDRLSDLLSPIVNDWRKNRCSPISPLEGEKADRPEGGARRRGFHKTLHLFQLDERAEKVLRVQEEHRLAVGTGLRLALAQNTRAGGLELVAGRDDVVDLVAYVVHAARRVLV